MEVIKDSTQLITMECSYDCYDCSYNCHDCYDWL